MAKVVHKTYHKDPKAIQKLLKRYGKEETGRYDVAVGLPKGGETTGIAYEDGTPLLETAFYNEFGTETIPARPAIKIGGREASKKLVPLIKKIVKEINDDKKLVNELKKIGFVAEEVIRQVIIKFSEPPNADATIEQKGTDNPLVDSGLYGNSIRSQVRKKK